MNTNVFGWFFLLLLCREALPAQEAPKAAEEYLLIRATDGNTYVGRALRMDSAEVVLTTKVFAELVFPRSSIRRMRSVSANRAGQGFLNAETPIAGAYFVGGSAHGLPAGEAYVHNGLLFIHRAALGITECLSIRGHILVDFDVFNWPMLIAPKFSLPLFNNRLTLALEGLMGRGMQIFTERGNSDFSAFHSLITVGSRRANLTVGGGWNWMSGRWARRPFFSIHGSIPLGKRWAFLTENYLLRYYGDAAHVGAFGFRFLSTKVNAELGMVFGWQEELRYASGSPWLGLSFNFY